MVRSDIVSESPFLHLTDSSRVPSLQESQIIQQLIQEKKTHLALLNSRVPKRRSGKKIPRELRVELEDARRFVRFHRALIAPWRRLPVEIIAEIFLFTLERKCDPDEQDGDYWNDDRTGTLLLCKICRAWRHIAITTPSLWNILSLQLKTRPLSDWVSTWLDRSRSFPVHLQVTWDDKALPDVINPVISVFQSHLHHTAALSIDGLDIENTSLVGDSYPLATFSAAESTYAPLLSIVGIELPPNNSWDWIRDACRASPCLSNFNSSKFSLDWFPVTNLTRMRLFEPVTMSAVFQILEQASGLQDIHFDINGPSVTCSTGKVLVMESISRIELTSSECLGQFLDQVSFPGVAHISILQIDNWPGAEFQSFLSRSSCTVKSLSFDDVQISEIEVVACLEHKACAGLESLVVSECDPPNANALLRHLTYHAHPFRLPHLTSLEFGNIYSADTLLASLVESRVSTALTVPSGVSPPTRLGKVTFSFIDGPFMSKYMHTQDWRRLEVLDEESKLEILWPEEYD
ncbi:hypothetical protein B0H16DRAFT_282237 [Mycena metata]|uniref:F-box domain-containing protein n=1 Tax=Mycena metata TaxID=1033252 RepID=A0AAD7HPH9_9AGAR|nr:hypothetical protein B0H16DRAFT_282237 [Mycena metata]